MKNTMGKREYTSEQIYWAMLGLTAYQTLLFCPLPGMEQGKSLLILWVGTAVCTALEALLTCRRSRNFPTLLLNVLTPLSLYTVASRAEAWWAALFAGVMGAVWFFWVLWMNRERKSKKPVVRHGIQGSRGVFVCTFLLCWVPLLILGSWRNAHQPEPVREMIGAEELSVRRKAMKEQLKQAHWEMLDTEGKLEILQTVADLEGCWLGLPETVPVKQAPLEEKVGACYSDGERVILVNAQRLERAESLFLVESVCHEAYHAYQFRLCDAWQNAPEDFRNLLCFADAPRFRAEFADYTDGTENYNAYASQLCESSARDYAWNAVLDYFSGE